MIVVIGCEVNGFNLGSLIFVVAIVLNAASRFIARFAGVIVGAAFASKVEVCQRRLFETGW